jgi:hypothetical protein
MGRAGIGPLTDHVVGVLGLRPGTGAGTLAARLTGPEVNLGTPIIGPGVLRR